MTPDIADQLRQYGDRVGDEVDPVATSAVVDTASDTPSPNLHAKRAGTTFSVQISEESGEAAADRGRGGRVVWLAVAAGVAAIALVAGALAIVRDHDEAELATDGQTGATTQEPAATYEGTAPPDLIVTAGDQRLQMRPNTAAGWTTADGNGGAVGEIGDFAAPKPEDLETISIPPGADLRVELPGPRWRVSVEFTENGGGECPIRYNQDLPRSDSGEFGIPTPLPVGEYMAVVSASLQQGGGSGGNGGYAFNVQTSATSPMPPRVAEVWWSHGEPAPSSITIWHPDALDDHPDGRAADGTSDGTNIAIGTRDHDTSAGLEPSTTAECGRGVTWLQIPEEDRAALAEPGGELFFGLDVRFADGLYAAERTPAPDGRVVVPLTNVSAEPPPPEPGSSPTQVAPPTGEPDGGATLFACLGCEWVGQSLEDAIAKAEAEGREWRDGTDGWDDDLRDGRVTFVVTGDVVTYAFVDSVDGDGFREGAPNPEDLMYVGSSVANAKALAEDHGRAYCVSGGPCPKNFDPERLQFHTDDGTADPDATVVAVTRG